MRLVASPAPENALWTANGPKTEYCSTQVPIPGGSFSFTKVVALLVSILYNSMTYQNNRRSWLHFISDKILESLNVSTGEDFLNHVQPCCVYKKVVCPGLHSELWWDPHSTQNIHNSDSLLCFGEATDQCTMFNAIRLNGN